MEKILMMQIKFKSSAEAETFQSNNLFNDEKSIGHVSELVTINWFLICGTYKFPFFFFLSLKELRYLYNPWSDPPNYSSTHLALHTNICIFFLPCKWLKIFT